MKTKKQNKKYFQRALSTSFLYEKLTLQSLKKCKYSKNCQNYNCYNLKLSDLMKLFIKIFILVLADYELYKKNDYNIQKERKKFILSF